VRLDMHFSAVLLIHGGILDGIAAVRTLVVTRFRWGSVALGPAGAWVLLIVVLRFICLSPASDPESNWGLMSPLMLAGDGTTCA